MRTTKILIAIAMMGLFLIPAFAASATTEPARAEIVWFTGYDTTAENMNPFKQNPCFGQPFMFEPLFGRNTPKGNVLIPVIGAADGITWAADGKSVNVKLNTDATFSDGAKVTADDVVFSYTTAREQPLWATMKTRVDTITKVSDSEVKFTLFDKFAFSGLMDNYLCRDVPIVPKKYWEGVNLSVATECDAFKNASLGIGSGPYIPYSISADKQTEIYTLASSWWGAGKIHQDLPNAIAADKMPKAKYIGSKQIPDNTAKDISFMSGEIDLHAGFFKNVISAFYTNPNLATWYGHSISDFYLPLGSVIYIAPNTEKFPFNDKAVRRAMAFALNYDDMNMAASGKYWSKAKVGILDNKSAAQLSAYDSSIESTYGTYFDMAKAKADLAAAGYTSAGGKLTKGDKSISSFSIIVPAGWSDVVLCSQMWADAFTEMMGISVTAKETDTNDLVKKVQDGDFDVVMQCCGPKMLENPLTLLGSYIGNIAASSTGATNYWGSINVTRWTGDQAALFNATYSTLETNMIPVDNAQYKSICHDLQEILATEMPAIPVFNNGFWYTYSEQYWSGWNNNASNYQQPVTAWTNDILAAKQRLVLNLVTGKNLSSTYVPPATTTAAAQTGIAWGGLEFSITAGFVVVVAAILLKRKHDI